MQEVQFVQEKCQVLTTQSWKENGFVPSFPHGSQPCVSSQLPFSLFLPRLQAGTEAEGLTPGPLQEPGWELQLASHAHRHQELQATSSSLQFLHTLHIPSAACPVPTYPLLFLAKPHPSLKFKAHVTSSVKSPLSQWLTPHPPSMLSTGQPGPVSHLPSVACGPK